MWIRFWHSHRKNPLISKDDQFFWLGDRDISDESLKEEARDRVPEWQWNADHMTYFGFERLEKLPDDIRDQLITNYENERDYAVAILEILRRP